MPEVIGTVRPKVRGNFKVVEIEDLGGTFVKSVHRSAGTGVYTITLQDSRDNETTVTFYSGAHVSDTEPRAGLYEGFQWWDAVNDRLMIYDGGLFVTVSGEVSAGVLDHLISAALPVPSAANLYEVRDHKGELYRVEPRQHGGLVTWTAFADGDDVSALWGETAGTYRYRGEYHIRDAGSVSGPQAGDVILTPGGGFLRYVAGVAPGFIYQDHPDDWLRVFKSEDDADHHVTAVGQVAAFGGNLQQVSAYTAAAIRYRWEPYEPADQAINVNGNDFDGDGSNNDPLQLRARWRVAEAPTLPVAYFANQYVSVGFVFYRVLNNVVASAAAIPGDSVNFRRLGMPEVRPIAPTDGLFEGYLWWDTLNDELKVYDGSAFVDIGTQLALSDDDPEAVAAAAAAGSGDEAARHDHAHALAVDETLAFSAAGELGVNVQNVVEVLSETVRHYTDANTYNNDQFATKGNIYTTSPYEKHIHRVDIDFDSDGTYHCRIVALDENNDITEVLGSSNSLSLALTQRGVHHFGFALPVPVARSQRIAVLLRRTDGAGRARCTVRRGAQAGDSPDVSYGSAGDDFHFEGRTRITENDPQAGDSLRDPQAGDGVVGNMKIHYTLNYDHANFVSGSHPATFDHILSDAVFRGAAAHAFTVPGWRDYDELIFVWADTSTGDNYTAKVHVPLLEYFADFADSVRVAVSDSDELELTPALNSDEITVRYQGQPVPGTGDTLDVWGFTAGGDRGRPGADGYAPTFSAGDAFPTTPAPRTNDFHLFRNAVDSGLDWYDVDGTTALTAAARGDVARYGEDDTWVKQANIAGVEDVEPDWAQNDPASPDYIRNRGQVIGTVLPARRDEAADIASTVLGALSATSSGLVGIAADADHIFVADLSDDIYALDIGDLTEDADAHLSAAVLQAVNANITIADIDTNGVHLYVADFDGDELLAFRLADGAFDPAASIRTAALGPLNSSFNCVGVAVDGDVIWVADGDEDAIYAFSASTYGRLADKDLSSTLVRSAGSRTNLSITGMATDGRTLWVCDNLEPALWAFDVSGTPVRAPARDVTRELLRSASQSMVLTGAAVAGDTVWALDALSGGAVYGYTKPETLREATELTLQEGAVEYDERVRTLRLGEGVKVISVARGVAEIGVDFDAVTITYAKPNRLHAPIRQITGLDIDNVSFNVLSLATALSGNNVVRRGSWTVENGSGSYQRIVPEQDGTYLIEVSLYVDVTDHRGSNSIEGEIVIGRLNRNSGNYAVVAGTANRGSVYIRGNGGINTGWLYVSIVADLEDGDRIELHVHGYEANDQEYTLGGNGSHISLTEILGQAAI